jgi:hypothetical protein
MQGERTYARLIQFCTWCMVALSPAGVSADYFARVAMRARARAACRPTSRSDANAAHAAPTRAEDASSVETARALAASV